jgi:hypothetical protein
MGELCRKLPVHQGNWVDHEITHARIEELLFGVPGKSIRPALYDPLQGKDWMEPMGHGHAFNLKLVLKQASQPLMRRIKIVVRVVRAMAVRTVANVLFGPNGRTNEEGLDDPSGRQRRALAPQHSKA